MPEVNHIGAQPVPESMSTLWLTLPQTSMILRSNHVNHSRTTLMMWMDCGNAFKRRRTNTNSASRSAIADFPYCLSESDESRNKPNYLELIWDGDVTMISGFQWYKVIFPDTAAVRPSYRCGRKNRAALAAG